MAHHRARGARRTIILRSKGAAERRLHTERLKKIAVYIEAFGKTRLASVDQVKPRRAPGDQSRKRLLPLANLLPLRVGEIGAAARPPACSALIFVEIDRDQFFR